MKYSILPIFFIVLGLAVACGVSGQQKETPKEEAHANAGITHVASDTIEVGTIEKTEEEWEEILTSEKFYILREGGTELAFKNKYYDNKTEGIYYCGACGLPMYSSQTKFHSGTGWPSFWAPIDTKLVNRKPDQRFGMERTEVVCAQCGSHLGHIFPNNTVPSGERHCLNSLALDFKAQEL